MARYIDADKLIERIEASPSFPNFGMDGYFLRDVVVDLINKQQTADVAPRGEEGWDSIPVEASEALKQRAVKRAKAEVAREIFEEIETLLSLNSLQGDVFVGKYFDVDLENDIAELKKKYTEDKNDG